MKSQDRSILIVSHDSGGAEILSSYVRQKKLRCMFALSGPAVQIFERKLKKINLVSLEKGIAQCDQILCGSGWQSDLEWQAIGLAKKANKHSVVFLDHWIDYRERFVRYSTANFPNEIWVGDEIAFNRAKQLFSFLPVRLVPNPYWNDVKLELDKVQKRQLNMRQVLYVCEPIREHAFQQYQDEGYFGYTEESAIKFFLENVRLIKSDFDSILIRKHPAEAENKYFWVANTFDLPIVFEHAESLSEQVGRSEIVLGCETMAMVIGLLAGKRVISCIPPGGRRCSLPLPNIEHLSQLLASSNTQT